MSLRNKIIRLAHANPELRKDLLPLITHKIAADYSGNYDSTSDFIDTHKLLPLAKKVFGDWWESSGDYDTDENEIQMLLKALKAQEVVFYVSSARKNRDAFEKAKAKYSPKMKYKSNSGELFVVRK